MTQEQKFVPNPSHPQSIPIPSTAFPIPFQSPQLRKLKYRRNTLFNSVFIFALNVDLLWRCVCGWNIEKNLSWASAIYTICRIWSTGFIVPVFQSCIAYYFAVFSYSRSITAFTLPVTAVMPHMLSRYLLTLLFLRGGCRRLSTAHPILCGDHNSGPMRCPKITAKVTRVSRVFFERRVSTETESPQRFKWHTGETQYVNSVKFHCLIPPYFSDVVSYVATCLLHYGSTAWHPKCHAAHATEKLKVCSLCRCFWFICPHYRCNYPRLPRFYRDINYRVTLSYYLMLCVKLH